MRQPPLPAAILFCALFAFPQQGGGTARAQEPGPLRRGSWAAFTAETDVLSADGSVLRKAAPGEVVRIRVLRGDWAEVGSSIPELGGGKVAVAALRPSSPEENEAWAASIKEKLAAAAKADAPPNPNPSEKEEAALEAAEPPPAPVRPNAPPSSGPKFASPVLGWFAPGRETRVHSIARGAGGSIYISGALKLPLNFPGARSWTGGAPQAAEGASDAEFAYLIRLGPELREISDFLVFAPDEAAGAGRLRVSPGGDIWAEVRQPGEKLCGRQAAQAPRALARFSPDLREVKRAVPFFSTAQDFAVDAAERPVILHAARRRTGGAFLTRCFSSGHYERLWPDAPDGPARRLMLDFSSPALAEGPFAIWAKRGETLPDFPTPIGDWGSLPNAGQPVPWTNVPSGENPIRGANLFPEAMVLDHEGNLHISGTIPFHMGNPDFDPFLLKLSESGKFLHNNCFLTGLLSEPDQKTQALAVDPSNGDILVSYWQHGNNVETLLLAPNGWLTKFTGTNGNIKITWIGRVDAATGRLKNSTYLYARMPESKNPGWPDLNSVQVAGLEADSAGWVYAAGSTTISLPTTASAFIPVVREYGGHPYLTVIEPDLSAPRYSTYLSAGQGSVTHLALRADRLAVVAGTHKTDGSPLPTDAAGQVSFLSASPPKSEPEAVFLGIVPVPEETDSWSF